MNELYESNNIHLEVIDEMDPYELENLMTELKYINEEIKNHKNVIIEPGGIFRQIFNIITGKRRKTKKQIELSTFEAGDLVIKIYGALEKRYRLVIKKEKEIEAKRKVLLEATIPIADFVEHTPILISPEIKKALLSMRDYDSLSIPEDYPKLASSPILDEDPTLKAPSEKLGKEIAALIKDIGQTPLIDLDSSDPLIEYEYSDKELEEQFGKLYTGLKTTDSSTTRRLKFNPPKCEKGNKSSYNKEMNLFNSRKEKIEKFIKFGENYIIDNDWIYFINIDIYNRGLCRMRLDASEPEEILFKDIKVPSSLYINDGMIFITDSKNNITKIRVPS